MTEADRYWLKKTRSLDWSHLDARRPLLVEPDHLVLGSQRARAIPAAPANGRARKSISD